MKFISSEEFAFGFFYNAFSTLKRLRLILQKL